MLHAAGAPRLQRRTERLGRVPLHAGRRAELQLPGWPATAGQADDVMHAIDEKILTESDRKRLDVLQFYGDYPITALMTLADLEFCKRAAEARLSTSHLSHSTATGQ